MFKLSANYVYYVFEKYSTIQIITIKKYVCYISHEIARTCTYGVLT